MTNKSMFFYLTEDIFSDNVGSCINGVSNVYNFRTSPLIIFVSPSLQNVAQIKLIEH